jgi:hypothetical protein
MSESGVIVRLHGRPAAVAKVVATAVDRVEVKLWQRPSGKYGCVWSPKARMVPPVSVIRDATPRELATGNVIDAMPPDTDEEREERAQFEREGRRTRPARHPNRFDRWNLED